MLASIVMKNSYASQGYAMADRRIRLPIDCILSAISAGKNKTMWQFKYKIPAFKMQFFVFCKMLQVQSQQNHFYFIAFVS